MLLKNIIKLTHFIHTLGNLFFIKLVSQIEVGLPYCYIHVPYSFLYNEKSFSLKILIPPLVVDIGIYSTQRTHCEHKNEERTMACLFGQNEKQNRKQIIVVYPQNGLHSIALEDH